MEIAHAAQESIPRTERHQAIDAVLQEENMGGNEAQGIAALGETSIAASADIGAGVPTTEEMQVGGSESEEENEEDDDDSFVGSEEEAEETRKPARGRKPKAAAANKSAEKSATKAGGRKPAASKAKETAKAKPAAKTRATKAAPKAAKGSRSRGKKVEEEDEDETEEDNANNDDGTVRVQHIVTLVVWSCCECIARFTMHAYAPRNDRNEFTKNTHDSSAKITTLALLILHFFFGLLSQSCVHVS